MLSSYRRSQAWLACGSFEAAYTYRQAKQATARMVVEARVVAEEAEAKDTEVDASGTYAKVTKVVHRLLGGKAP